jgi:glycosyltransferase involved in cell wall biosynthesis
MTLRVLYVESSAGGIGGSHHSLWTLVSHLDRNAVEPEVLCFGDDPFWDRFRRIGVRVHVWAGGLPTRKGGPAPGPQIPPSGQKKPWAGVATVPEAETWLRQNVLRRVLASTIHLVAEDLPRARRLMRLAAERRVDILHANDRLGSNRFVALAGWMASIPVVQHERLSSPYRWTDILLSRSLAVTFCVSGDVRDKARRAGHRGRRLLVLPNAVALDRALPRNGDSRRRVGVIGRIARWKGQDLFIEAMATVARTHHDVEFLVIGDPGHGDPAYLESLRAAAEEGALAGRVVFTGHVDDVFALMSTLDVVVSSTRTAEPFGRSIIEAMAAGIPVVAPDAGGPAEILENGVTGILYAPGDPDALARAVAGILDGAGDASSMTERARTAVATRFSGPGHASRVIEVYQSLAGAPQARAGGMAG